MRCLGAVMIPSARWLCSVALLACVSRRAPNAAAPMAHCPDLGPPAWSAPPPWLHDLVSRGLFVRDAGVPVDAPADDVAVLRTYLDGRGLGPLHDGSRITLLAPRRVFAVAPTPTSSAPCTASRARGCIASSGATPGSRRTCCASKCAESAPPPRSPPRRLQGGCPPPPRPSPKDAYRCPLLFSLASGWGVRSTASS
mgnify:CR=1 FL=1